MMTFDEWFDKESYDEQHRFVFGLAWNAGMNAAGETGLDVDAPIRKEAARYRWLAPRMLAADFDYGGDGTQALVFEMPVGFRASADCGATIDAAMAGQG